MADTVEMDEEKKALTKQLINLTLQIIYFLTGEHYGPIKKPIDPPTPSMTPARNNVNQILKVTQKIIELLTREVPIRCQDVTVYFSMEEWEYLEGHRELYKMENLQTNTSPEGHKDLYKDTMMEKQSALTFPGPTKDPPVLYISGAIKREQSCEDLPSARDSITTECHRLPLHSYFKEEPLLGLDNVSSFKISKYSCHTQSTLRLDKEETLLAGEHLPNSDLSMHMHDKHHRSTCSEEANSGGAHFLHNDTSQKELTITLVKEESFSAEEDNRVDFQCNTTTQQVQHQDNEQDHRAKKNPVICSECGKSCWCKTKLHVHQKVPTRWKPFTCFECGKCFPTNSAYRTHKRVHTGEKPYACSECGKCFRSASDLRNHRRTHTGEKPFCCSDCGLTFSRSSNLSRHRRTHTGDKPYSCQECDKRFVSSYHLAVHQRIHTGVKPYCCLVCGNKFSCSSGLKQHQKIHQEEKLHSCMECGKRFKSTSNLARHRHIHSGERPYRCSACEKCFTRKEDLLKHQTSKGHDIMSF